MAGPDSNLSCLLYGPHDVKFEDREVPSINDPHDVIVRIAYVGVCGSDVGSLLAPRRSGLKVTQENPLTMGHEASGTVHSIGDSVTTLQPGDDVCIEPGVPCSRCKSCKSGRYNLCPDMAFAASPGPGPATHGCLCRYYKLTESFLYKLPSHVSLEEGVLVEPLAVAVHSNKLAGIKPGHRVVVFGAGPVGILCAAVARQFGAVEVISVDMIAARLEFAKEFAATDTYAPDTSIDGASNAAEIVKRFRLDRGADVVIEATGAEPCVQMGIHVLAPGGTYVQTGCGKPNVMVPMTKLGEKEAIVKGCFRYGSGDFEMAVGFLRDGKIDVKQLISRTVSFREAPDAWESVGRGEGIKTLICGVQEDLKR
ncbi:sorbitol dehydrogenase [Aureobasidium subglaciale]|nr:sorbitol dehydrogenase [Aureobasidium subglaciale]KAI5218245.1 sorbitol dehydrogenase [Aureobasidium subglaciale]KAI5221684.1 sorbitol dehydrogenase [Aureobasidium subglaciale]KAI5259178.1 sorbitol dehydrogenase [Aureobasidium subglaciale]